MSKHLHFSDKEGRLNSAIVRNIDASLPYILIFITALVILPLLGLFSIHPFVQWVAMLPIQVEALVQPFQFICSADRHPRRIGVLQLFDTGFVTEPFVSGIPFNTFSMFLSLLRYSSSWSVILAILLFSRNTHAWINAAFLPCSD